jgi:anti-sigma regulatory factor (Ser/Thr protein kinase)
MHLIAPIREYCASMDALPAALDLIEDTCRRAGLGPATYLRAQLAVEELFTNSVRHGYGGDSRQLIWLSASTEGSCITLTYQDAAPPYNPAAPDQSRLSLPVEQRPVGGLGISLIAGVSQSVEYARSGGRNTVVLKIAAPDA